MKKLLVTLTTVALLSGNVLAETQERSVELKPKWNLMGTSFEITDMSRFDKPQILILWTWDTENETWQFYTGDSAIEDLVRSYGYNATVDRIPAFKGFWVRVMEPVEISLPVGGTVQPPPPEENHPPVLTLESQIVTLKEGETGEVGVSAADPDNDTVTIIISSSNETVALAEYDENNKKVKITAQSEGNATIIVTATDDEGARDEKTISVTVEPAQPQVDYSGYLWIYGSPDANVVYWDKDQTLSPTSGDVQVAVITFEKPIVSEVTGEFPYALLITNTADTQSFLTKPATQVTGMINICFNSGTTPEVLSAANFDNCEVAIKIDQNLPSGDYKIVKVENGQIVGEVATYHKE